MPASMLMWMQIPIGKVTDMVPAMATATTVATTATITIGAIAPTMAIMAIVLMAMLLALLRQHLGPLHEELQDVSHTVG